MTYIGMLLSNFQKLGGLSDFYWINNAAFDKINYSLKNQPVQTQVSLTERKTGSFSRKEKNFVLS